MADCEVEGTIASPLSIPPREGNVPDGERSDEGTSELNRIRLDRKRGRRASAKQYGWLFTRSSGSRVVKVSDRGWHVASSSRVPLKTHRVGERCTLNLSRAQTSFRWCGVPAQVSSSSLDHGSK
ncbi:hypothetical protein TNCV_2336281 [Trichonephila clavipes]|uniref:Uncharacterized protein n=1 Tax=Trichonephila clavipes TaxID=2585209 RepID=A0A8X6SGQ1_TRICX|nr:hypothetical protein TNCV_2336281 [Trichonephila clavipes]